MRYRATVDESITNSSQSAILRHIRATVPTGASVLDVGCASGDLARALVERGYRVSGVDVDAEAVERARDVLVEAVVADLETDSLTGLLEGPYDVVILADVLEHLTEPHRHLAAARELLAPGGVVLASIPNVAHGALRLALLQGRWHYTAEGLLDTTHMRFFTYDTVLELFQGCGLEVGSVVTTELDVLSTEVAVDDDALPDGVVEWVRDQPHATSYQFIVEAHIGSGRLAPPDPRPLVTVDRPHDIHHARRMGELPTARALRQQAFLDQFREERARLLTLRDYAIGGEASAARLRHDLARKDEELTRLHERLAATIEDVLTTHERLAATIAENRRLRLLNPITLVPMVLRRVRRALGGRG